MKGERKRTDDEATIECFFNLFFVFVPRSSTMNCTLTACSDGLRSTMRVGFPGAGAEDIGKRMRDKKKREVISASQFFFVEGSAGGT